MSTKGYAKYVWLAWILTLRELKGRYKTAVLGFMWAFVNPLIQLLVLGLVFSIFLKVQVPNYPVFLLSGLLPWTFFSSALTQGTSSLINNRDIIKNFFPPSGNSHFNGGCIFNKFFSHANYLFDINYSYFPARFF